MVKKFRKKPVVIEAIQYDGINFNAIKEFVNNATTLKTTVTRQLVIRTLEGPMTAQMGDWIIKGINGEFYPCKPDIFEKTYEEVK